MENCYLWASKKFKERCSLSVLPRLIWIVLGLAIGLVVVYFSTFLLFEETLDQIKFSKTYETVSHSVEIDAYQCPEQPVPAYVLEEFYTGQLSCDSIENHVVKTEFLVGKGKLKAVWLGCFNGTKIAYATLQTKKFRTPSS